MEQIETFLKFEVKDGIVNITSSFEKTEEILLLLRKISNTQLLETVFSSMYLFLLKNKRTDEVVKFKDDFILTAKEIFEDLQAITGNDNKGETLSDDDETPIVDPEDVFALGGPKDA